MAIVEEFNRLLAAGFIRETHYLEWLSNMILVKKLNDKWMKCVDFTDLNKVCPKDSFPLPQIDFVVDSIARYIMLNFMDAYSEYNQIWISLGDEEKISFITDRRIYCCMPFGLKNAEVTYQRLVNHMLKEKIEWNIEVYADDLLRKGKESVL
ncbi:hypothetical protein F2P56_026769 [Juglans regia]|uniref:Reverse transcriptase domain-containing protein n=1 Tax=Juglans regia TaxID=51240 RepID=A0A833UGR7_JUGRE|nr:hypothetical protein F2P56_026769 [Juglans regia]